MAKEIDFENRHFWNFVSRDLHPDLGWPWKWYHREWLIDPNKYHYLVCGCIEYDCGCMYGRTDVRRTDLWTDIFIGFIRSSLRRWPKNGSSF